MNCQPLEVICKKYCYFRNQNTERKRKRQSVKVGSSSPLSSSVTVPVSGNDTPNKVAPKFFSKNSSTSPMRSMQSGVHSGTLIPLNPVKYPQLPQFVNPIPEGQTPLPCNEYVSIVHQSMKQLAVTKSTQTDLSAQIVSDMVS